MDNTTKILIISASVIGTVGLGILLFGNNSKFKITKKQTADDKFDCPLNVCKVTSKFGTRIHPVTGQAQFHNGDDFAGQTGTIINAPANGIVTSIYTNSLGGNQLIIKHPNGYTSGYAHLSKYLVQQGQNVKRGDAIAQVGATGQVTGSHLHFTLRNEKGDLVNPINYIV